MKKLATTLALVALCASSALAANAVRISQVYGGGGATSGSPTYSVDYVELFNNSGSPVNISGWSIAYGSASGTWGTSGGSAHFEFPANTIIQPCKYILVSLGAAGTVGAALPVPADFSSTAINASATAGKVGLFTAVNSNVACGAETGLVDKVAYGASTTCPETTPVSGLSNTQGAVRNGGGTVDTDNNSANFTVVLNPVPRNSASPANQDCLSVPTQSNTWGSIKSMYR